MLFQENIHNGLQEKMSDKTLSSLLTLELQ